MLLQASAAYAHHVRPTAAIVELDGLLQELSALRGRLEEPGVGADEDALWELEVAFRHLAARAQGRAELLRRQIDLLNEQRRAS